MICFPNAKINLGLNITQKRSDGFHDIETVFYPIAWHDALEVVESTSGDFNLHTTGITITGAKEDNLLYKAYQLIKKQTLVPAIDMYLHKTLPMGAGLGGGSADAAFFINLLNTTFQLQLSPKQKATIAKQLGSDCAFFIENKPVFAFNKGDDFKPIILNLSEYYIAVIYPNVHSNTQEAYSLVKPQRPIKSILDVIAQPIETWKNDLVNDFEASIFSKYPVVQKIKNKFYANGALYASMSGSGSAVFGIFNQKPTLQIDNEFPYWIGKML